MLIGNLILNAIYFKQTISTHPLGDQYEKNTRYLKKKEWSTYNC